MWRIVLLGACLATGCAPAAPTELSAREHDTVECEREAEHRSLPHNPFSPHHIDESFDHCMRDKGW